MNTRIESLGLLWQSIWEQLHVAAQRRGHGWRVMAFATLDDEGAGPRVAQRSVVVREVDVDARALRVYTDARSAKVRQLGRRPEASLLAWCPQMGWQLRMQVRVEVETDGLAIASRWATLKLQPGAQDYLSPLTPGSPLDAPDAPQRSGRSNFALMTMTVDAMDWLELHPDGQRRAGFDARGAGRWLSP